MRVVALLAAIAALWVQPARAAQFLEFTGTLTPDNPTFVFTPGLFGGTYFRAVFSEKVSGLLSFDGTTHDDIHEIPYGPAIGTCCSEIVHKEAALIDTRFVQLIGQAAQYPFVDIGGGQFSRTVWENRQFTLTLDGLTGPVSYQIWGQTFSVPEPSTWAMMILGIGFVGAGLRRRQAATALGLRKPMSFLSSTV